MALTWAEVTGIAYAEGPWSPEQADLGALNVATYVAASTTGTVRHRVVCLRTRYGASSGTRPVQRSISSTTSRPDEGQPLVNP